MKKVSKEKCAYIAGLFDGEGTIGYYKRKKRLSFEVRVKVGSTDPRPIHWLQDNLDSGCITVNKRPPHKTFYEWQTKNKAEVIDFLTLIYPYLLIKREQAELIINFLSSEVPIPRRTKYLEATEKRENMAKIREEISLKLKELKIPPSDTVGVH